MASGKFATVINCIDGRTQMPVSEWIRKNLHIDFVDTITEPGPDKKLQNDPESIKQKVLVSINAHHSNAIAIAGHCDCAGNPASDEEHKKQIKECTKIVKSWGLNASVLGLWVNEKWEIEVVDQFNLSIAR